jgi:four helix bundle protein
MSLIKRFEEIEGWQEARLLTQQIYLLSQAGAFAVDTYLSDKIRQAAIAVMSNIAEGFDCDSSKEFATFLGVARRAAVEVQSLLYVALDAGYIDDGSFQSHYAQVAKIKTLVGNLKRSLEKRT